MFSRINISNFRVEALFVNQDGVSAPWVCLGDKQHLLCEGKNYLWNFYIGKRETISRNISFKAVWISRNFSSFLALKFEALRVFISLARATNKKCFKCQVVPQIAHYLCRQGCVLLPTFHSEGTMRSLLPQATMGKLSGTQSPLGGWGHPSQRLILLQEITNP